MLLVLSLSCGGGDAAHAPHAPTTATARSVVATTTTVSRRDEDASFTALSAKFLERMLELRPDLATTLGDHRYDGRWPDLTEAGEAKERAFLEEIKGELLAIDPSRLSVESRVDHAVLANQIEYALFAQKELRGAETNPLDWTGVIGDGLDPLLSRDFAPLAQRLSMLASRLDGIPAVVTAAKSRLREPARIHTETAIEQNRGLIALVASGLEEHLRRSPESRPKVEAGARKARAALEELQNFLEKDLLARSRGDFRLGRQRYEKKLRFVLDDPEVNPDELAQNARALLEETREKMVETALEVWPLVLKTPAPKPDNKAAKKALIRTVLGKLADDRPTNATIVTEAAKLLEEATTFVRERDLVRLPEEVCRVIEMPEYRRGVAIAYCDSTGPLEAKQESFYAIAPTPKDWPATRVTSFYREYNRSMLRDLTVHEAMPGHFLQAMHANRFKSGVRAVYASGPFVEGWAVYTEWLMAKHGFGGPKTRLMREKMALRMCANAVLDHDIHAGTMDEREALALMTDEAFQEEGEAIGKWRRARLTSAQLSTYFYGFREMMKLRLAAEKKSEFKDRVFSDAVLSHGSPPMRHLKVLLQGQ